MEISYSKMLILNHLCSKTTITSSVNGRTFSVVNDSDLD